MAISAPPLVSPAQQQQTTYKNYPLVFGGYFSLAFSALQLSGIWWSPNAIRYMGGPATLSVERPIAYALLCVGLAIATTIFGLYALSGAGRIRPLPLLRTGLVIITLIYLLRGSLFFTQFALILRHPEYFRFLLFSAISLCVGIVHLVGVVKLLRRPVG